MRKKYYSPSTVAGMAECVLQAINIGTVVLDQEHLVVLWNRWMEKHSGVRAEEILGLNLFDFFPDLRNSRVESAVEQALHNNFPSLLSQTLNKAPFALYTNASDAAASNRMQQAVAVIPIEAEDHNRRCLIQISDVSVAVARERQLREQALVLRSQTFSDGLTGIANRRHFDVSIDKEFRRAKRTGIPISLLMIDIDYFKAFNDHYGHQRGDDCLIQVAGALGSVLHRPADLVARYGGEEFAVILPDNHAESACMIATAMRQKVEALGLEHAQSRNPSKVVTISIGVAASVPQHHHEAAGLIQEADRALYEAKRLGRNQVVLAGSDCVSQSA
ncbi:diguanylate cyclase [Massilia sp. W12]|uniref:diguanylate cyclase n=1 Tax=Massilia sp. W12 TaxID=3126507 RepID=UPI0030CE1358